MITYEKMSTRHQMIAHGCLDLVRVKSKYPLHFEKGSLYLKIGVPYSFSRIWCADILMDSDHLKLKVMPLEQGRKQIFRTTGKMGWVFEVTHHIDEALVNWLRPHLIEDTTTVLMTIIEEAEKRKDTNLPSRLMPLP